MSDSPHRVRGYFGKAGREWFVRLLQTPTRAHLKVAAFVVARLDGQAGSTALTRAYIRQQLAISQRSLQRALALLESEQLFKVDYPPEDRAGGQVRFTLSEADSSPTRQFAKVYKADTLATWFREAPAGVVRTWIAHQLYLRDQRFGRVHFASNATLASVSGQPLRTVRENSRWLEERGVLVRVPARWAGSNLTVFSAPARMKALGGTEKHPALTFLAPPPVVTLCDPPNHRELDLDEVVGETVHDLERGRLPQSLVWWEGAGDRWVNVAQLPYTRAWLFLGERPRRGPTSKRGGGSPTPNLSRPLTR